MVNRLMSDKPRILLVEDDRAIAHAMALRLRAARYDVMTEFDGCAGLASAIANRPNAIVLDIRLPGMDGMAALSKLREKEETREIPVVMLSASIVDQRKALDHGAQYFLEKPYNAKMLIAAIENAISGQGRESVGARPAGTTQTNSGSATEKDCLQA